MVTAVDFSTLIKQYSQNECLPSRYPAHFSPLDAASHGAPQDGLGTRKYSNGNLYEGKFSEGEASGEGTMRYVNG